MVEKSGNVDEVCEWMHEVGDRATGAVPRLAAERLSIKVLCKAEPDLSAPVVTRLAREPPLTCRQT
ncbi:hypothetical protein E2C01_053057 [Portunus trituberculatus]|uniref:Uncharacterized protein n=1 Tax=Portunus trituberculatus TaxID=210409 RepID=A0A5B7GJB4_PORTR|nr:hypothetical protein [Portunus trituberculatus]